MAQKSFVCFRSWYGSGFLVLLLRFVNGVVFGAILVERNTTLTYAFCKDVYFVVVVGCWNGNQLVGSWESERIGTERLE